MIASTKFFKIAILDDSKFYKTLFTHKLGRFAQSLAKERGARIAIRSFDQPDAFMRQLEPDTDLAFIDYYLGDGKTASDILPEVRILAPNCTVIIISRSMKAQSALRSPGTAAERFIHKDEDAFDRSAQALRELVEDHIGQDEAVA